MSHVLIANHMANNGRVIVVGQIAHYNSTDNVPNGKTSRLATKPTKKASLNQTSRGLGKALKF